MRVISPPVSRSTLGFSTSVTRLRPVFLAYSNACRQMFVQPCLLTMRVERATFSRPLSFHGFIFGLAHRAVYTASGSGMKLDAAVHAFGVLAEDDLVDRHLAAGRIALQRAAVVERVAGVALARPHVRVQVEHLPELDDRREVDELLVLELRRQFLLRVVLRLAGDRAEQAARGLLAGGRRCGRAGRCLPCTRTPSRCRRARTRRRASSRRGRCWPRPSRRCRCRRRASRRSSTWPFVVPSLLGIQLNAIEMRQMCRPR